MICNMTLDEFRQSLTAPEPPAGLTLPSLAYGGMPRAIGREPTNLLSRTKAWRVRGFTLTCIARKAIRAMRRTGMVGRGNPFAGNPSMPNGSRREGFAGVNLVGLSKCKLLERTVNL